jgi:hypothetical protein
MEGRKMERQNMTMMARENMNVSKYSIYRIRLEGHLDPSWSEWLDGMTITTEENGETLLTGVVVDQAALHGLLERIRDLNLILISINREPKIGDDK